MAVITEWAAIVAVVLLRFAQLALMGGVIWTIAK
jgi:hypothetical protein